MRCPAGTSPREVGKRVAEHFVTTPHPKLGKLDPSVPYIAYPESMAWYGALAFAQASDHKELTCGGWSFELFRNDF